MSNIWIAIYFWVVIVILDAFQDWHHSRNYGNFSHKTNFLLRLMVGLGITCSATAHMAVDLSYWIPIALGLYLIAIGWIVFDFAWAIFLGFKWKHMGSGGIDLLYKKTFAEQAWHVMIGTKICLFLITNLSLYFTLQYYRIL
jgi:hypothetical protein